VLRTWNLLSSGRDGFFVEGASYKIFLSEEIKSGKKISPIQDSGNRIEKNRQMSAVCQKNFF
jgi:hypothetical protein